jgi:hypothetical protein
VVEAIKVGLFDRRIAQSKTSARWTRSVEAILAILD